MLLHKDWPAVYCSCFPPFVYCRYVGLLVLLMDFKSLAVQVLEQNRRALARALTLIENEDDGAIEILDYLFPNTGLALRIGITGPPGAGKSTLTNQLIRFFRQRNQTVGIIAIDPTSPFTGGAILGDRVRMNENALDPGVFIRSMATRGSLGGLVRQAQEAADLMDAGGLQVIIFETVGVGQIEIDIMEAADTIVVLAVPDAGDMIQSMKAGLMEIGDLFVVNKADLDGSGRMKADLEYALHLRESKPVWAPQVFLCESRKGIGIDRVVENIFMHIEHLQQTGEWLRKRERRFRQRVRKLVETKLNREFWNNGRKELLDRHLQNSGGHISPYQIADQLLSDSRFND